MLVWSFFKLIWFLNTLSSSTESPRIQSYITFMKPWSILYGQVISGALTSIRLSIFFRCQYFLSDVFFYHVTYDRFGVSNNTVTVKNGKHVNHFFRAETKENIQYFVARGNFKRKMSLLRRQTKIKWMELKDSQMHEKYEHYNGFPNRFEQLSQKRTCTLDSNYMRLT